MGELLPQAATTSDSADAIASRGNGPRLLGFGKRR
jgi:hypothetical protein